MKRLSVALALLIALGTNATARADTILPTPPGGGDMEGLTYDGMSLYLFGYCCTIYRLDPVTAAVLSTIPAPFYIGDMEYDGVGRLIYTNLGSNTVEEMDLAGNILSSFGVPFRPGAIAFDGTLLYIWDFDSSRLLVTTRGGIVMNDFITPVRPSAAVFDASTGHILTIDAFSPTVEVISTDGTLLDGYSVPLNPPATSLSGITIVGTSLYVEGASVPGGHADQIHVFDAVCGNGDIGPAEQCDDGNTANGDCCSSTCQFETNGSPCATDGNPCTVDACDGAGSCLSQPPTGCKTAGKSLLLLKNDSDDARDKLAWKWLKGAATVIGDLGNPASTTNYTLCVSAGTAAASIALPSGPGWQAVGTTGFRFKDSSGTPKALLKSGSGGKAKALVKGKGTNLPDTLVPMLPLPVTVQLVNDKNSTCFGAVYDSGDVKKNDAKQFKAKAQ